eukprot:2242986-Lingulodinium_polyedra.AAC.1
MAALVLCGANAPFFADNARRQVRPAYWRRLRSPGWRSRAHTAGLPVPVVPCRAQPWRAAGRPA